MTTADQQRRGAETAQVIRGLTAMYDQADPDDRAIDSHIRDLLQREQYRRERAHYPEYIDHGGEG